MPRTLGDQSHEQSPARRRGRSSRERTGRWLRWVAWGNDLSDSARSARIKSGIHQARARHHPSPISREAGASRNVRRDPAAPIRPARRDPQSRAIQGRARPELAAAGPRRREGPARRARTCARTITSGWPTTPRSCKAAHEALDHWGNGLASVRFICGTQEPHKELEKAISEFLGTEDTILYSSCWDANGGLFETILGAEDAVISDELNHASIIDGIRLCKAKRLRYKNNDMADLEAKLQESRDARFRLIATDGVFSMDGIIADLKSICDLADKYDALVMVDDSHAVGFMGKQRPGHARVPRRDGPRRYPHRHARQGPGRRQRRLHERSLRDRHHAPPAVAAVSLLELGRAADPGRLAQGDRDLQPLDRAARPARGKHPVLPRGHDRAEVQHRPRRAPDHRRS